MSDGRRPSKLRYALFIGACAVPVVFTDCDNSDYPLEPTFCDDWCRVLLRKNCTQEPENCVRNCERSVATGACYPLQERLLECYQGTSPDDFVCEGRGFQSGARPKEHVCQAQRDELIDCAYPDVKVCLDVCRQTELALQSDAGDAGAADGPACPSSDVPCDSICWLANSYVQQFREDAAELDASLDQLARGLFACMLADVSRCRSDAGGDADAAASQTWAAALKACSEDL